MRDTQSPLFHTGELAVQDRMGVRERVARMGARMIRDHLIDQHRDFYAELPFLVLGAIDDQGRPWASIVTGTPGFLTTPDDRTLDVAALPLSGDPLAPQLKPGSDVGILGIQLETRRRNRMNGQIATVRDDGFAVSVRQSYGNCPRFIQSRLVTRAAPREITTTTSDNLDGNATALIKRADTLFIASAYRELQGAPSQGADVSHRGGKPGFVRIEDDRTLVFPDFSGNNIFNTVGNLSVNPRAGLLFPDFEAGDLLSLTGRTEIVWDGPQVDAFTGAERLIRFRIDEAVQLTGGLPLATTFGEYGPHLARTGDWAA